MKNTTPGRSMNLIVRLALVVLAIMAVTATANAATFTVTNANDNGPGSLRQAILDANFLPGADIIEFDTAGVFSVPRTITLADLLLISDGLTVNGTGAANLSLSGNNSSRVISVVSPFLVTLNGMTITAGNSLADGSGIYNAGRLSITNSTIANNTSFQSGGGIYNSGTLTVANSTVTGNFTTSAFSVGGGIHNSGGTLSVTNSSITSNTAAAGGGGISNEGNGVITVSNSIISNNLAAQNGGGGISTLGGTVNVIASTISGNSANAGNGGGIFRGSSGPSVSVIDSTVSNNFSRSHGGGIFSGGPTTISGSTISGNVASGDGGGIFGNIFSNLTLTNSTVSGNSTRGGSGGGVRNLAGVLTVTNSTITGNRSDLDGNGFGSGGGISAAGNETVSNTIVAGNFRGTGSTADDVRGGTINTPSHNIIGDAVTSGGVVNGAGGNIVGMAVGTVLDTTLANNGGSTQTHRLKPLSPAIDAGSDALAAGLTTDQRGIGFLRVLDGNGDSTPVVDIGAYEFSCSMVVTNASNSGPGSLRQTIADACPNATITFDTAGVFSTPQTITLADSELAITRNISILGPGADRLTISGNNASRVFTIVFPATAELSGLTMTDGNGSGVYNIGLGGAILNAGTLTVSNSVISDNSAAEYGGGIASIGTLTVIDSTISNNLAAVIGGGIASQGDLTVINSTISGNSAADTGGGIFGTGSGILGSAATVIITSSTITDNEAGINVGDVGGVFGVGATVSVGSSIIAENRSNTITPDVGGATISSAGYNLIGISPNIGVFSSTTGDQVGTPDAPIDPLLDPLALNGGPTKTHALGCGSLPIDAGLANGLTTDQRGAGFARTFDDPGVANAAGGDGTDIGAYELQTPLVCNTAPAANNDSYSTNEDTALNVSAANGVLANDTDAETDTLTAVLVSGPSNALSFTLNANGSFTYMPSANYNGGDSFTYKANDGSFDSNVATVVLTVNPVNDVPVVSASPKTQPPVQYSDAIQTVTISASDLETPQANLTVELSYTKDFGPPEDGLPLGMVQGGTGGAWTVSGTALVPQGTYTVQVTVTDGGDGTAPPWFVFGETFTIVVIRENAVAAPKINNPVSMPVVSPGGTATGTTDQICFDITEVADGSLGDTSLITAATVQINAAGGGGAGGITPSAVTFSGGGVGGTRTACFALDLSGAAPNVYEVTLVIGGDYYTGSGTTAFSVFDPSAGFVSGGGWIINPTTGYRANFGVNVKYLKNGKAQGSLLYVEHRPDGDYKVKSTALNANGGFAIVPVTGGYEAQVAGKANYVVNDVGTGNYSFIARVVDKGTPGTNDQFGLKLIDPLGQVVTEFTFSSVTLGGGNNQVPKK